MPNDEAKESRSADEASTRSTRDRLLDATERILREEGIAGVTTRRVAAEAGVNPGLVHYYFGSVEQMLISMLDRVTAHVMERVHADRAALDSDGTFFDRWRQTTGRILGEDMRRGWPKIWMEIATLSANRPDVFAQLSEHVSEIRRGGVASNDALVLEYPWVQDDPRRAESLSALLAAVTSGLIMNTLLDGNRDRTDLALEALKELLEQSPPPGKRPKDKAPRREEKKHPKSVRSSRSGA